MRRALQVYKCVFWRNSSGVINYPRLFHARKGMRVNIFRGQTESGRAGWLTYRVATTVFNVPLLRSARISELLVQSALIRRAYYCKFIFSRFQAASRNWRLYICFSYSADPLRSSERQLSHWTDYFKWRQLSLNSPVALLLHWVSALRIFFTRSCSVLCCIRTVSILITSHSRDSLKSLVTDPVMHAKFIPSHEHGRVGCSLLLSITP